MSEPRQIPAADVEAFVLSVCTAVAMPDEDARMMAVALVDAELRGVSSHGCARLPAYARALAQKIINPAPAPTRIRGGAAVEVLDGDNGLGIVLGQRSMTRAVEMAGRTGIAAVATRNSNHTGMLATHVMPAVSAGMIGYFTSNAPAIMAPWGGRDPALSNGPMAYGIPTRDDPLILDMASSATNRGRIRLYATSGQRLPAGWAIDDEGNPTTDPTAALRGAVLPMGGHKGYGLAIVNEVLAGALTGARLATQMPRDFLKEGSRVLDSWGSGHLAVAIDIAAFAEVDDFLDQVDALCGQLRSARPSRDSDRVRLPGDIERDLTASRRRAGIRFSGFVVDGLDELADELDLARL
jgi:LDH2 family malate/lactate/ureidoglycolate dehydrogenase